MVKLGRWRFSTCASAEGDQRRLVNWVDIDAAAGGEGGIYALCCIKLKQNWLSLSLIPLNQAAILCK